ncbi:MAG: glycosyltransferase, partial [Saprospiraceae bacterium]
MNPEIEISVVIPTHNRVTLLKKLLHSIEKSNIPVSIKKIIIIENGSHVSEELVNSFQESLPIDYQYFERGNKSLALNYTLEGIPENHFVLFFDDDIEVSPNVFTLYESAVRRIGKGHYFGGPTGVNYEEAPLSELIKYMPDSNRGISQELKEAGTSTDETFLGFNWGAFREDLMKISGFSELYGPGASSGARGQETDAQLRLLDIGVKPIYVPDALVHHWVPKHHLTKEWVMDRLYKSAMRRGKIEGTFIKKIYWVMMLFKYKLLGVFSDKLELDYLNNVYSGYLEGSKLKNNKSNHSRGIMVVLFALLFLGSCTIPKEVASIY